MSNGTFDFNEFIKDSKEVLTNPKSYFSTMKTSGGLVDPLIKAVIYGALAGLFSFIWSLLHIGVGSMFGGAIGAMAFVWSVIGAIIGLFIGAVILLVISSICKGSTDFEANARVTAAVMVVMPISALLGFASGVNIYLGVCVSLAVNLFSLWLLYHGLVEALKAKPETTKIVTYILIGIIVLFTLIGLGARKKANRFMNEFNNSDLKELMEDIDKN
ncbi:MAG TPA: Yip1 family protein [Bacteroidales bacterium]|nr:Yip1 family protein [Bacteroidales bacterium]